MLQSRCIQWSEQAVKVLTLVELFCEKLVRVERAHPEDALDLRSLSDSSLGTRGFYGTNDRRTRN
jgi:hypothetical protein